MHLTGKKKNRDWMVDGDNEDGEEEHNDLKERGGLEEEEEPLFGRGVVGELPPSHVPPAESSIRTMPPNAVVLVLVLVLPLILRRSLQSSPS